MESRKLGLGGQNEKSAQKRKPDNDITVEDSNRDIGDEDNSSDSGSMPETVNVDLVGASPTMEDAAGIASLLHSGMRFLEVSTSDFVEEIIFQNHIGSVLKLDGDGNEVVGICTALRTYPESSSKDAAEQMFDSMFTYLQSHPDILTAEKRKLFETVLGRQENTACTAGALIYDRVVNMTVRTAVEQLESLNDELAIPSGRPLNYLVLVERLYQDVQSGQMKYQLPEQELLEPYSIASFDLKLSETEYGMVMEECEGEKREGYPYRRIVLFKIESLGKYIDACREAFASQF